MKESAVWVRLVYSHPLWNGSDDQPILSESRPWHRGSSLRLAGSAGLHGLFSARYAVQAPDPEKKVRPAEDHTCRFTGNSHEDSYEATHESST